MSDDCRFGICGAGSFGCTRARALAQLEGGQVTAGWSRSATARDHLAPLALDLRAWELVDEALGPRAA